MKLSRLSQILIVKISFVSDKSVIFTLIIHQNYPIEDFPRILDILRNEKPLYYEQRKNWPTMAWLTTRFEPVGEGIEPPDSWPEP